MQLHWVDLLIIAVVALSIITGLIRGFVKELIALAIWVLAIWLAYSYSQELDPFLQKYIQDKTARTVTAFIAILVGTLISGGIINAVLGFILKRSGLSGTDRILGMGFGFIRGVFIIALVMVVVKMTSIPYQDYANNSKLYARFDPIVDWLYNMTPEFIKQVKVFDSDGVRGKTKLVNPVKQFPFPKKDPLFGGTDDFELSDA
ncbi:MULTISPECIES: CvpA family protein [unclassified Legionella]|uniref:CvpA family protein n=1 Tax=unclassified Legionella TaxID=2622702 RepID=UPI001056C583|nr:MULTISPECIES: CvpA family protein [unclassified Legionella]MDI9818854.1 CvpA family protein [Legionella sp. PL877]